MAAPAAGRAEQFRKTPTPTPYLIYGMRILLPYAISQGAWPHARSDWTGAMRLAVPHSLHDSVFHASLILIKQLTDQATRPRTASMALWLYGLSQSVFYCTAPPRLPLMTKYYM